MKPITLTLPLYEAKRACAAILPHTSSDDVTPVITCAYVEGKSIVGTDRYTVARHELSTAPSEPFMLHRSAVAWIARMNMRTLANYMNPDSYTLRIESPQRKPGDQIKRALAQVTVSSELYGDERMMKFDTVAGNYPPVGRLFDGWETAAEAYPISLAPDKIERITSWARSYHRDMPVLWELGKAGGDGSSFASKHQPMRASIAGFAALIQPNLRLR